MRYNIYEGLRAGDLKELVLPLISIDEYKSKLGNDKEVIVVAFFVEDEDPANDLSRFIEKGANKILDTEPSPAPNEDGYYLVFVEYPRGDKFPEELMELIGEIKVLVDVDIWKFKPYKHKKVENLTKENVEKYINIGDDGHESTGKKKRNTNEAATAFLMNSFADRVGIIDEKLVIETPTQKYRFNVIDFGTADRTMRRHNLNSPFRLDESARWQCNTLEGILGAAWSAAMVGETIILTHALDDRALILQNG
jgi:hypothetical protein